MGNICAGSVLDRLHIVYGVDNDNQLAERLEVKRSTMGNWRSRDSVPYTYCVEAASEHGYTLDWILAGLEPMRRDTALSVPSLERSEATILKLYRALDEPSKLAVQGVAEEKARFIDLENQLKSLTNELAHSKKQP